MKTVILVVALALGLPLAAVAEEDVVREADREVVKKTTKIDFNESELDGELTRPQGDYIPGREHSQFDSLLKPREDFLPELEKSAEGL